MNRLVCKHPVAIQKRARKSRSLIKDKKRSFGVRGGIRTHATKVRGS